MQARTAKTRQLITCRSVAILFSSPSTQRERRQKVRRSPSQNYFSYTVSYTVTGPRGLLIHSPSPQTLTCFFCCPQNRHQCFLIRVCSITPPSTSIPVEQYSSNCTDNQWQHGVCKGAAAGVAHAWQHGICKSRHFAGVSKETWRHHAVQQDVENNDQDMC
jgi:hypothetical protein